MSQSQLARKVGAESILRVRGAWGCAVVARPALLEGALAYETLSKLQPSGDSLALPQPLALSEVLALDRRGTAAGTGALAGALLGAVGGAAAGAALADMDIGLGSHSPSSGETAAGMVGGGLFGALLGAGIGALVGSAFPKWHAIYEKPSPGSRLQATGSAP